MKFTEIGLSEPLLQALAEMGFVDATPIQEQGLPLLLQGEDLVGQAQTGTGKTAAFGLSILEKWLAVAPENKPPFRRGCATPSALIMAPTRELAIQVAGEIYKMGKYTGAHMVPIYGGQDIEKQIREFGRPVDIVVGTPGRILDHLERNTIDLSHVTTLVLDEADRMLDMGFMDDVISIIKRTPNSRQTLMFSATMPREILGVSYDYMKSPQHLKVSEDKITVDKIKQYCVEVPDPRHRLPLLLGILRDKKPRLAIIFVRTKMGAERLGRILRDRGMKSMTLHGDMSQNQRDSAMRAFREGHIHVLVATDLASRGLDVFDVSHVINYDLPEEHMTYIHRIGRTGRAGAEGEAVSLVFPDQALWMEDLVKLTNVPVEKIEVQPEGNIYGGEGGHGGPRHFGDRQHGHGGHERINNSAGRSRGDGFERSHGGRGAREGRGGFGRHGRGGEGGRGGSYGGEGGHGRGGGVSGMTMKKIRDRATKQSETHHATRHGHTYVGRQA